MAQMSVFARERVYDNPETDARYGDGLRKIESRFIEESGTPVLRE